jgi:hypothetical protein
VDRAVAPGLALLAACFSPEPQPGGPCAAQERCPSPLACIAGICRPPGPPGDGPAGPDGALQCPSPFEKTLSGACHLEVLGPAPWPVAELDCEQRGGHLVVPDSVLEATQLGDPRWIGVSDRIVEGAFRAVTGPIVAFSFWDTGEPSGGPTNCAHTGSGSLWHDGPCDFPFPYVCEYDGLPAAPSAF